MIEQPSHLSSWRAGIFCEQSSLESEWGSDETEGPFQDFERLQPRLKEASSLVWNVSNVGGNIRKREFSAHMMGLGDLMRHSSG